MRTPLFALVRSLAAGIAALGLVALASAAAAPPAPATGELTLTAPGQGVQAEWDGADEPQRQRLLEQQIERMTTTARQQQELVQQLRSGLASAQSTAQWVPLLGMGLGAMLLIAAWLAVRLRRLSIVRRRERDDARMQRLIDARTSDTDGEAAELALATASPAVAAATPLRRDGRAFGGAGALTDLEATAVGPGAGTQRAVSVEEMLDLEQQADFFVALGQEEAAIDLLMVHIRGSGGASPVPYLKLLEIYRGRGDEDNYERTRTRFNLRFNAVAPAFADDLGGGRDLEQYPQVLRRIEQVWPNALAALDTLINRRDDVEPFDLPACRDLMLLSVIAQDLRDVHGEQPAAGVDILLPLDDAQAGDNSHTVRRALASRLTGSQALPPELMSHLLVQRERSGGTAALDLDLSGFTPAPREFTRPAAFTDVEQRDDSRHSDLGAFGDLEPPANARRH